MGSLGKEGSGCCRAEKRSGEEKIKGRERKQGEVGKEERYSLLTGIQYMINSSVLFAREYIKAGGKIRGVADYICNSTIERIGFCSPATLSASVLPNNRLSEDELKKFASKVKSFGSAGKRTQEQTAAAARAAETIVKSLPPNSLQIWTDGSKTGKGPSGPAGAGAYIIYTGDTTPKHQLIYYLGNSTNQVAEIWAIGGALTTVRDDNLADGIAINIFSDSEFTLKCLNGINNSKVHYNLFKLINDIMGSFPKNSITLHKVAGHAGIPGNDIADGLANQGALYSDSISVTLDLTLIAQTYGFNHQILRDDLYGDIT